jgi:hypothetical protein
MEEWRYSSNILDLSTRWMQVVSFTLIGGWVGPRAGLNAAEKRKALPFRESNPGPSIP